MMKRRGTTLLALLLSVATLLFLSPPAFSASDTDEGYYIDRCGVDIVVHDNRTFEVTETLDVTFLEERRGIFLRIPTRDSEEGYRVSDIWAEGAAYVIEREGDTIVVRLGSPDVFITGEKRYTIHYTLCYYQDGDPNADHVYQNIVGPGWDCNILHVDAAIHFPTPPQRMQVYTSPYGETQESTIITQRMEGNTLYLSTIEALSSGTPVTLHAALPEGSFSSAPVYVPPYQILGEETRMTLYDDRTYHTQRNLRVKVNEKLNAIGSFTLPSRKQDGHGYMIQDLEGTDVSSLWEDAFTTSFYLENTWTPGEYTLSYSYQSKESRDEATDADWGYLVLPPVSPDSYENSVYTILLPDTPNLLTVRVYADGIASDMVSSDGSYLSKNIRIDLIDNVATVTVTQLPPGSSLVIEAGYPDGYFQYPVPIASFLGPLILLLMVAVGILLFYRMGRDTPLTPVVEFYPPDYLNPAEIGYIINRNCSASDVTSLIFYWAGEGHLSVLDEEDSSFTLSRGTELDGKHKQHEKSLYTRLFAFGDTEKGTVTSEQLHEVFAKSISLCQTDVFSLYHGTLDDHMARSAASIYRFLLLLSFLAAPLLVYFDTPTVWSTFGLFAACFTALFVILWIILINMVDNWYKKGHILSFIALALLFLLLTGLAFFILSSLEHYPPWLSLAYPACLLVMTLLSPLINRRSAYGQATLERILGFRQFLVDAEKERLETLIEETPSYFYDILPFAIVLGVTNVLEEKFREISIPPASWYESTGGVDGFHTMWIMHRMTHTMDQITHTMTSVPPPAHGGGSGGGFSGGGFSGGGGGFSGGGGGSSGGGSW